MASFLLNGRRRVAMNVSNGFDSAITCNFVKPDSLLSSALTLADVQHHHLSTRWRYSDATPKGQGDTYLGMGSVHIKGLGS